MPEDPIGISRTNSKKYSDLICDAPVNHVLCRLAAAYAGIAHVILFKGDASGTDAGQFLHLIFAFFVAAPHCLHQTVAVFSESSLDFLNRSAGIGLLFAVCESLFVHTGAYFFQLLSNHFFDVFDGTMVFSML